MRHLQAQIFATVVVAEKLGQHLFLPIKLFFNPFQLQTHLPNTLRTLINNSSTQNTQKRSKNMKSNRASFGFLDIDLFFQTTLKL